MLKTYVTASSEGKVLLDALQHADTAHKNGICSEKEILTDFLLTSARYLGVDVDRCQ
jgi:hypothetical protein